MGYTGHMTAASNRADLLFGVGSRPVDQAFMELTNLTITVALPADFADGAVAHRHHRQRNITVTGPGTFTVHFTRAEMATFPPGDADVGITVALDGVTYQIFAGQLPVVDGVVAV